MLATEAGKEKDFENDKLFVMDPKRRRTERPNEVEIIYGADQAIDSVMGLENNEEQNQKNGSMAGAAMQSRQSL